MQSPAAHIYLQALVSTHSIEIVLCEYVVCDAFVCISYTRMRHILVLYGSEDVLEITNGE